MTTGIKTPNNYYINLVTEFPPRPISNEVELRATQHRVNTILDKENLTQDDRDYLRVLGMLIYEYEEKYERLPELKNADLLQALMEEYNLQIKDFLDIFETEETISGVLQGKRMINSQEYQNLIRKYY
jgi:HTH-type transcriptional regulator/antitoxin HigA